MTPILMLGAGRMGGALIEGWRMAGALQATDLIVREPHPNRVLEAAQAAGASINPPDSELARARTVLLAVKPQMWREAAAAVAEHLATDAVIVSIAAGVKSSDIAAGFGGKAVARVMPTTAVAVCQGTASIYAADEKARERAHGLFAPVGAVVDVADEDLMHAATGVSGSAPAYLYAFVEALEAAGASAGLPAEDAARLARSTIAGAAALMARSGEEPAELRKQVTSPGGTTQAALEVLMAEEGFPTFLRDAVAAATRRSKELGG